MTRIEDKTAEISTYLEELGSIVPATLDEYRGSLEKRAACERYVEKIVEAAIDLAFLIIKSRKLRIPQDDADAFSILEESSVISSEIATKMKEAKGMRNIISHQYGKIDDEVVFEAITEELGRDVGEFIEAAARQY